MDQEMITITRAEYDQLCKEAEWLGYLEAAGVDNWQGYDEAMTILAEMKNGE